MRIRMAILTFVRLLVEYPLVVGDQLLKDLHVSQLSRLIEVTSGKILRVHVNLGCHHMAIPFPCCEWKLLCCVFCKFAYFYDLPTALWHIWLWADTKNPTRILYVIFNIFCTVYLIFSVYLILNYWFSYIQDIWRGPRWTAFWRRNKNNDKNYDWTEVRKHSSFTNGNLYQPRKPGPQLDFRLLMHVNE